MEYTKPTALPKALLKQSGASAVEFALVLPLLIALTYATVVYSYVFVIYESINYAAQQGAESASSVDPIVGDSYDGLVIDQVRFTIAGALSWFPASMRDQSIGANAINVMPRFCSEGGSGDANCPAGATGGRPVVVRIEFPVTATGFPMLNLPGIGMVPPLPTTLVGVGVAVLAGGTAAAPGG